MRKVGLAVCVAALALALYLGRRFMRFEVVGASMAPGLVEGDYLLVDRHAKVRPGDVVVARDPREPARVLVKRVSALDAHGGALVLGDNPAESTDGRAFGPVGRRAILGRVRWRYYPFSRRARVG